MTKTMWAPWRGEYVGGEREEGCVFCLGADNEQDPERLVVGSSERAIIIMNRYPYASGHVMITPREHVAQLAELSEETVRQMWALMLKAQGALTSLMSPDGFNVGLNLGAAAGAGIADHLHMHVVPRWKGDNNFMPVLADVRVMPEHLAKTAEALRDALKRQ